MAKQTKDRLLAMIADQFAYIELYAPAFPAEDQTTTEAEVDRIVDWLRELAEVSGQVLAASLEEVSTLLLSAQKEYRSSNLGSAERQVSEARTKFKALVSPQKQRKAIRLGGGA